MDQCDAIENGYSTWDRGVHTRSAGDAGREVGQAGHAAVRPGRAGELRRRAGAGRAVVPDRADVAVVGQRALLAPHPARAGRTAPLGGQVVVAPGGAVQRRGQRPGEAQGGAPMSPQGSVIKDRDDDETAQNCRTRWGDQTVVSAPVAWAVRPGRALASGSVRADLHARAVEACRAPPPR